MAESAALSKGQGDGSKDADALSKGQGDGSKNADALSKGQDDGSKNADALNKGQSDVKVKMLTLCLKDKATAIRKRKSKTRMTAGVLKQDPGT